LQYDRIPIAYIQLFSRNFYSIDKHYQKRRQSHNEFRSLSLQRSLNSSAKNRYRSIRRTNQQKLGTLLYRRTLALLSAMRPVLSFISPDNALNGASRGAVAVVGDEVFI
jgi:hypothetical protein